MKVLFLFDVTPDSWVIIPTVCLTRGECGCSPERPHAHYQVVFLFTVLAFGIQIDT